MNAPIDPSRSENDGVVVPRIWVAFALSVALHIAALWGVPHKLAPLPGAGEGSGIPGQLTLRLAPRASAPPPVISAVPQAPPGATLRAPRPQAAPRAQPPAPVIALNKPAPEAKAPLPVAPPAPAEKPAYPAVAGDLSAYIEAQRRARAGPAPAPSVAPTHTLPEDAETRRNRVIAGNLGSQRDQAFGYDPTRGGGMFQITRVTSDYAEFIFYGWNRDVNRNTKQVIEVRKGEHSDIRLAVVRKMIAIIREDKNEEFLWVSQRLGRSIMLSARPADNAGLEDFMLRDFF